MKSVLIRKPGAGNSEKPGPAGLPDLRTIPRKPNEIGFDTQTRGPAILKNPARPAVPVCVRFPGNPMKSVLIRKPGAGNSEKPGPAGLPDLRTIPRKPNEIGFDTQTRGPAILKNPAPGPTQKAGGCRLTSVRQSVPPAPARTLHRTSGPGRPGCF